MKKHSTINIKVNAPVDRGIAPLVLALNRFDGLLTLDSCEGYKDKPAYVYFRYGAKPKDLTTFCYILAEKLSEHIKGANGYSLRVEWDYDFSNNMAALMTERPYIHKLTAAIKAVANEHRKTPFLCGKLYKEPHSSQGRQSRPLLVKARGGIHRYSG
jgi:hypothetical protein